MLGHVTTKSERYPRTQSMQFAGLSITCATGPSRAIKLWKPIERSNKVRAGYLRSRGITWII